MTDPSYCLWVLNAPCQPLTWWSSAASWAQAILTVLTFAGTVVYQANQTLEERRRLHVQKLESHNRELALARVFAGRELRRWRRAIRLHQARTFESATEERAHGIELLDTIRWEGSPQELQMLGAIGELLVDLIAGTDEISDRIAQRPMAQTSTEEDDFDLEGTKALWTKLESQITKLLATMNRP